MLGILINTFSKDPSDVTVYINAVAPQKLERNFPTEGFSGESCIGLTRAIILAGIDFLDSRKRAQLFLSVYPRPIPRIRAAVQPICLKSKNMTSGQQSAGEEPMDSVKAARNNRVDILRQLSQIEGLNVLSMKDRSGHTPAHWAALEGHVEVIQFLIDAGVSVDITSEHPLRQQPIHWACTNGNIGVIECLVKNGVSVDVTDANGCTPLITACQYSQTATAAYIMGRGAQLQATDSEGDNALHWAAFRGRPELVRLLIYSGFNPHQRDNQGQGALHLAAISGNLSTVRDLCQIDKVNMFVSDANGRTAFSLAKGRRHDDVKAFLEQQMKKKKGSIWAKIDLKSLAFGPPGKKREAQLFFILISAIILYPVYFLKIGPALYSETPVLQWIFIFFNLLGIFTFYKASTVNPGYIARPEPDYDRIMRQIGNLEAWSRSGKSVFDRLCHTCRIVKPYRAKHCRICDRCVLQMDHHCPYIYNCVGYHNRHWFFCFIYSIMAVAVLSFYFIYLLIAIKGFDLVILFIIPFALLGTSVNGAVGACLWYSVFFNITTNEMNNKGRYTYLKNSHGRFRNPFDRGIRSNVMEYFHCKKPISLIEYQNQRIAEIL